MNILKEIGDFLKEEILVPATVVKGSIDGIKEIDVPVIKAIKVVVKGTIT